MKMISFTLTLTLLTNCFSGTPVNCCVYAKYGIRVLHSEPREIRPSVVCVRVAIQLSESTQCLWIGEMAQVPWLCNRSSN